MKAKDFFCIFVIMYKDKNIFLFVRFGGLDLKKQKGFSNDPTFHAPPTKRGIYAMPKIAQEFFLIGSIGEFQKSVVPKEKYCDRNLSYDDQNEYYREREKKHNKCLSLIRKEFSKRDGYIWHHLIEYVKHNEVINSHGSWIKTDMKTWAKAFSKMSVYHRYGRNEWDQKDKKKNISTGIMGSYSKDHCEVFFDEKV